MLFSKVTYQICRSPDTESVTANGNVPRQLNKLGLVRPLWPRWRRRCHTLGRRTIVLRRAFVRVTAFAAVLLLPEVASAGVVTIAWDRNPETNIAGYRVSYGTVSGAYTTTVDVGNRLDWQIRGVEDGQKYYFVVRAINTAGAVSPPSTEISVNIVGLTALTTDMVAPTPTGKAITWTALAGPGAQLEFKFWRYSQATGAWSVGQDYSSSNSFTWTPGAEGTYAVQVWARKAGSTENFEAVRSTGFFNVINHPITIGSLEADVALPPSQATTITWTARATGGPPPLQYQFWRYDASTSQWVLGKDYSTSNTYSWTPGTTDIGQHVLQVWVRGAGSSASFESYRSTGNFEVRDAPVSIGSLTANKSFPAGTGDPITWNAVAAGPGPLEYSFYLFLPVEQHVDGSTLGSFFVVHVDAFGSGELLVAGLGAAPGFDCALRCIQSHGRLSNRQRRARGSRGNLGQGSPIRHRSARHFHGRCEWRTGRLAVFLLALQPGARFVVTCEAVRAEQHLHLDAQPG